MKKFDIYMEVRDIPGWVSFLESVEPGVKSEEWELFDEKYRIFERDTEKKWRTDVKSEMREWLESDEMVSARQAYDDERIDREIAEMNDLKEKTAYYIYHTKDEKKQAELLAELREKKKHIEILTDGVTSLDIERAVEYPIERIVEVTRGMALCVEHDDKKPSMNCRNNFAYCHSCGFTGNSIVVYRKVHNVGFREAVNFLSK